MKFSPGEVYVTTGAKKALSQPELIRFLNRHLQGDWGDLDDEDKQTNEIALQNQGRLFSVYHTQNHTKIYVITEADRSATTLLLPEEY